MTASVRIVLVGLGKIAHDQHLPAIAASAAFELAGTVSTHGEAVGALPHFATLDDLLRADLARGAAITMELDWRQTGPQSWDITVDADAGTLKLERGGAVLTLPDGTTTAEDREYPGLYAHFAELIHTGARDVDTAPLRVVPDAFLRARRQIVEEFHD